MPKNIIITHGRIAAQCLKAKSLLPEGEVGVILCEYVAPYDKLANEISEILERVSPETILFVEEEIKAGGFGMMLSDTLRRMGRLEGVIYDCLATDDPFVKREKGMSYLEASGLDSTSIAKRIKEIKH